MKKTLAITTAILITLLIIPTGAASAGEDSTAEPTPQQVDELRAIGIPLGAMAYEGAPSEVIVTLPNPKPITSLIIPTGAASAGEDSTAEPTPQQVDELRAIGIPLGAME